MLRLTVLALTVCYVCAYGGAPVFRASGHGYGGGAPLFRGGPGGYGLGGGLPVGGRVLNNFVGGPINAAVHSTRTYEVLPVPVHYEAAIPQTIEVPANVQPINMIFRTQSSPLNVQQVHTPSAPVYQSSRSEDQPSVLTHENYKPVIQEYRETIQPFRRIEQRIEPVIENVHTVVAKGDHHYRQPELPQQLLAGPAVLPFAGGRADYK